MNDTTNNSNTAAWSKAKSIRETHGITAPQLRRYAQAGLIRTSNLRLPGQTRGNRLFNMADVDRLIESSIEPSAPPKRQRSLSDD